MRKILKYVLGFTWITLSVLFLAGLIWPKVKYETQTTVSLPLNETFLLFNNIEKTKEWIPELSSIRPLKETPNKVGSQYKMVMSVDDNKVEMLETVKEYKGNQKVTLAFDMDIMEKTDAYTFTEKDGETNISAKSVVRAKSYINRCFFAFLKGSLRKGDQGYLDNFKKYAEQTPQ